MLDRKQNACVGAALLALALLSAAAPPARADGASTLRAVSLEAAADDLALTLEFDRAPLVKTFRIDGERPRLVIDLSEARARVGRNGARSGSAPGAGPVSAVRFAERDGGVTRVVLDLSGEVALGEGRVEAVPGGARWRAPLLVEAAAPSKPRRRIVIDAGHGGRDPGAIGATGVHEKDVTLAAALALRKALESRGFDVRLTREDDTYLPLFDRVARARAERAELFISLHADASENPEAKGASVYTLSERGERRALALAGAQNWSLDLETAAPSSAVKGVLMDLAQRETVNRSAEFAQTAIARLAEAGPLLRNTHRNAGFAVLLAPDVPAVLIEMGFMTNAEDEARLTDPLERARITRGIADAVEDFFSSAPQVMAGG